MMEGTFWNRIMLHVGTLWPKHVDKQFGYNNFHNWPGLRKALRQVKI